MTLSELREKRERLVATMAECVGEDNQFIDNEAREKFDAAKADYDRVVAEIRDAERVASLESARTSLPETMRPEDDPAPDRSGGPAAAATSEQAEQRAVYSRALNRYLRGASVAEMTPDEQRSLRAGYTEFRDMSTISGPTGGYVIPEDTAFYGTIVQALKFFGGVEAAGAEVISTAAGNDLPIPTNDDTGNVGAIVNEEGSHTGGTSPTLAQKVLHAHVFSTKIIKVSGQFFQDSAIDVEGWLGTRMGERLGRIQNTKYTTGTGANEPEGVMTASSEARQAVAGNTTTIPFDDVYRIVHGLDRAYRNERCRWMMHDDTILALRLAKDGEGRYLWPEMGSVQAGQPTTLAGYPIIPNNDVAQMAASARSISFGDHFSYKIRRVRGMVIRRLDELYAENWQVGFVGFMRSDGGLVDAGQGPVKHFKNSAT